MPRRRAPRRRARRRHRQPHARRLRRRLPKRRAARRLKARTLPSRHASTSPPSTAPRRRRTSGSASARASPCPTSTMRWCARRWPTTRRGPSTCSAPSTGAACTSSISWRSWRSAACPPRLPSCRWSRAPSIRWPTRALTPPRHRQALGAAAELVVRRPARHRRFDQRRARLPPVPL